MVSEVKLSKSEAIWHAVIFLAVILTAMEAPFSFVFQTKLQDWQVWSDLIISGLFAGDIAYQLSQRRKRKLDKSTLTVTPSKYNNLSLIIDFICVIPFDFITYAAGLDPVFSILNLVRLLRLLRLLKLVFIVNTFSVVPKGIKLAALGTMCLLAIHLIACGWVLIHPPTGNHTTYYVKSLYWAITTLTTIGYGDITPTTTLGRLYTMVIMILGVGVYGIVIGNVSRMIAVSDRYKEQSKEKVNDLLNFMRHYNVPERVQGTVFSYYNHILTKRLTDNDTQIIADLPHALQSELRTYMNMKLIATVPIFRNCTHACLKSIAASLEQQYFAPGQNIIRIGEVGSEMFIIGHGKADVILKDGNTVASLHEGQFFGEAALLRETTRNADVRSVGYSDLYILKKDDFLEIIKKHPELLANIENQTKKRATDS